MTSVHRADSACEHSPSSHTVGSADAPKLPQNCEASVHQHSHNCIHQWSCLAIHGSYGLLKAAAGAFNSLPNSQSGGFSLQCISLQICNSQGMVLPYLPMHCMILRICLQVPVHSQFIHSLCPSRKVLNAAVWVQTMLRKRANHEDTVTTGRSTARFSVCPCSLTS